jgi:hypothetical protein
VSLDPNEQAAYSADPSGYLAQYGYEDVQPDDISEAFSLVADTLPPELAQTVAESQAAGQFGAGVGDDDGLATNGEPQTPTFGAGYEPPPPDGGDDGTGLDILDDTATGPEGFDDDSVDDDAGFGDDLAFGEGSGDAAGEPADDFDGLDDGGSSVPDDDGADAFQDSGIDTAPDGGFGETAETGDPGYDDSFGDGDAGFGDTDDDGFDDVDDIGSF